MGLFSKDDDDGYRARWAVTCESDPRFNMSGYAYSTRDAMQESDAAIRAKIKKLNLSEDQIPKDIEYSGWKK